MLYFPMGRTACTEPQCLCNGALYLTFYRVLRLTLLCFLSAGRFLFLSPPRPICCRLFDAVRCAFRDHCSFLDIRYVYNDILPQTKTVYYVADFKKQITYEKMIVSNLTAKVFSCLLQNFMFCYCLHRNPPWNAIVSQLNPAHTLATPSVL